MIRPILKYPDPRLKGKSEIIKRSAATSAEIQSLAQDLVDTLKHSGGLGLSAPQIGVLKRVIVVNVVGSSSNPPVPHIFINPIVMQEGPEELDLEGCLSFPGVYEKVKRPSYVSVVYTDKEGTEREGILTGNEARCILHEIDHLNGVLFIERLGPTKRTLISNKLKKLRK